MALRRCVACGLLLLGITGAGCVTRMGARAVRPDRLSYNQSIVDSGNEQLLLNLVRLRYRDRPLFLELQSVVSQRSQGGNLSGGATFGLNGGSGSEYPVGGAVIFEERPTVTYAPLQGEDFATRILSPLSPETIILLSSSGWSIERLLLTCVSRFNGLENAPSASGPTPDEKPRFETFHEVASLLRRLQTSGALTFQAFQASPGGPAQIRLMIRTGSGAGDKAERELEEVRRRLGWGPGTYELRLTTALAPTGENEIAIHPRSLLGVLSFLSQAVEPPDEHEEGGWVTVTRDDQGRRFDWAAVTGKVLRVRSQKSRPAGAFVAVPYREYWFYIEESDLNSKSTFSLLHFLLSLQSGGGSVRTPMLTLPAG